MSEPHDQEQSDLTSEQREWMAADLSAPKATPPADRCCPVCNGHYTTNEDECPHCRKQFASSIASLVQPTPPAEDQVAALKAMLIQGCRIKNEISEEEEPEFMCLCCGDDWEHTNDKECVVYRILNDPDAAEQPAQPLDIVTVTRWTQELTDIGHAVATERRRQLGKWGVQDHELTYWLGILMEEVGELARTIIEENDSEYIEKEAVQVAAVASAIAQKLHYGGPV